MGKLAIPWTTKYVETADSQSDGLQVLGIGELRPIYQEGMEKCYILEPL